MSLAASASTIRVDHAEAHVAGIADGRRAGGFGLGEQVVAVILQAGLVDEVGELDLAEQRGVDLAGNGRLDLAQRALHLAKKFVLHVVDFVVIAGRDHQRALVAIEYSSTSALCFIE